MYYTEDKRIENINKNLQTFLYYIFRRVRAVRIDEPDEGCPRTANRRVSTAQPTLVADTAGRVHGRRPLDGVGKR